MVVTTHIVKVKGTFDRNIWNEDKLKKYVRKKIICNIDHVLHTHLELFKIDDNKVEVWVYIHALPSEVDKNIIKKWIYDNIKEEGLKVEEFSFDMITDLTESKQNRQFIYIPADSFNDINDEERKWIFDKEMTELDKDIVIEKEYIYNKQERRKEEGILHKVIKI